MISQCPCRCAIHGSCLEGTGVHGSLDSTAWSPGLLQKCILKSFCKMTCLTVCALNDIWYVLRSNRTDRVAAVCLHVVQKQTLETASPRNISWDTELAGGCTWQVLWSSKAVRVIIWCSTLIVNCIMSISLVVRHATWPKRTVHWQLQMVYTQTVTLGVWVCEQTSLDEHPCWSS